MFLDIEDGITLRAFKFLIFKIFKTIKKLLELIDI